MLQACRSKGLPTKVHCSALPSSDSLDHPQNRHFDNGACLSQGRLSLSNPSAGEEAGTTILVLGPVHRGSNSNVLSPAGCSGKPTTASLR
jgi:hypothetical protein